MGICNIVKGASTLLKNRVLTSILLLLLVQPTMADTVLITGANSGIGLEFAHQYAEKGWDVIATHRRSSTPESIAELIDAYPKVREERMDVTNLDQIKALAAELKDTPIDLLINNAGVYNDRGKCDEDECPGDWTTQSFGQLRYGLFDLIFAVNVRGPLMVSEAFADHVRASGRKLIVCISSSNGSLTDPYGAGGGGAIFYRASKAALNRSMQLVAESLREDGVTVVLMHPGAVLTERQAYLRGYEGMIEMPYSVENMIKTIDTFTIENTGQFIQYDGETVPW